MSKMVSNEFMKTRKMFASFSGYKTPLTYDAWMELPKDHKLAVLFCQFYEQITLAWFKLVSEQVSEPDGVEEVLQYLNKNVEKIENDENRFTKAYIYTICFNCLVCLCQRDNKHKKYYDHEVTLDFDDFDDSKLDFYACDGGYESVERDRQREIIWTLIESKGRDAAVVVAELIGDETDWFSDFSGKKTKKFSKWDHKRISDERRAEIIADLREDLLKLREQDELDLIYAG